MPTLTEMYKQVFENEPSFNEYNSDEFCLSYLNNLQVQLAFKTSDHSFLILFFRKLMIFVCTCQQGKNQLQCR